MLADSEPARAVHARVLQHLLARVRAAAVWTEPFCHTYLEDVFPADVYAALLDSFPPADRYLPGPSAPGVPPGVRTFYNLTADAVRRFPARCRDLWCGVCRALTDPELKRALYARLAVDLIHRFGVEAREVPDLAGYPRPTLYRDAAGYALPPHPDTLKKVVTMHLYLPADLGQVHLGTALYRREPGAARGDAAGFTLAKQFEFRPNSGYAFVVNDGPSRQSWHGREPLPADAGTRNTLLNTFYSEPRPGYTGYVEASTRDSA
jgi:hypothetical protein